MIAFFRDVRPEARLGNSREPDWRPVGPFADLRFLRRPQSRDRRHHRPDAAVDRRGRRRRGRGRETGLPGLARHAPGRSGALDVPLSRSCSRSTSRRSPRIVTSEHGKTLDESRGSVRRGIEMRRGRVRRAVADDGLRPREHRERASTATSSASRSASARRSRRSTFPAMVPLWFLPFAIATGNTFILKPSEQVPLSQRGMVELLERVRPAARRREPRQRRPRGRRGDLRPPGHPRRLVRRVDAGREARSTSAATHAGKRVQALGGAKNFVVVMPDADFDRAIDVITESFYGCAGERCLAGSVLVPVGVGARARRATGSMASARALKVGDGTQPGVAMGPRHQRRAPRAGPRLHRARASPRARGSSSTAAATRCPTGRTATSSVRRSSTTCRPDDDDRPRRDLRARRVDLPGRRPSTTRSR